jgi:SAM-dependent methyltransferase
MWKSLLPLLAVIAAQVPPQVGQPGKDVVWVPTVPALVERMLDMAHVAAEDVVIDLGSGDGRTVIAAARRGARATGIEYNADMVALSARNAASEGVADRATFLRADLFETDLSKATVVTMFLLPEINVRLRPKILDLTPGTRVVSNTFAMGDWSPDETATIDSGCVNWCTALLWIVPAKVNGGWKLAQGELHLKQSYQVVGGTFEAGPASGLVVNGRVRGDQISFLVGASQFAGKVAGNVIEGTIATNGKTSRWKATRTADR